MTAHGAFDDNIVSLIHSARNLPDCLRLVTSLYDHPHALRYREAGYWQSYSTGRFAVLVRELFYGLRAHGVGYGDPRRPLCSVISLMACL